MFIRLALGGLSHQLTVPLHGPNVRALDWRHLGTYNWDNWTSSVTRLGNFLKFLLTNFLTKVAKILGGFWRFLNMFLQVKTKGSGCVAQLVERSFPIPEVRGSNPVFGKNLYWTFVCCQLCVEKTKIKKRGREWPIFLKVKTNLRTFWATLKFNLATFYFNIWSHCDHHWSVLLHHSEPVNLNPSRAAGLTK